MSKNTAPNKVNFDEYADDYEKLLEDQLRFFSSDRSYFSRYKANLLAAHVPVGVGKILDFGAGIGLMIPHLREAFPEAQIHASDISESSLSHLKDRFPDISVLPDSELSTRKFDLILIATVLHHVSPDLRAGLMQRLNSMLSVGGRIAIFEHNPLNPVTQRMVATCPFDEDAVLLGMRESVDLLCGAGLQIERRGYTLFLPPKLHALHFIEKALEWLPLGGQYYVIGRNVS